MRHKKNLSPALFVALLLVLLQHLLLLPAAGAQWPAYRLTWDTSGGLASMGGVLDSTLGQVAPGRSGNQAFRLDAGFWQPAQTTPIAIPTPTATPGPRPAWIYLPLSAHRYAFGPPVVEVGDAPGRCPGRPVEAGAFYSEDFDTANDNDWYRFTAISGATYRLQTSRLGARADTLLGLYGPDCSALLVENDDSGAPDDKSSLIVWTAPAAGDYHILVRNYDWQVYGPNTGYWLRVVKTDETIQAESGRETQPGGVGGSSKSLPAPTPAVEDE